MKQYLDTLKIVLDYNKDKIENDETKMDRTGVGMYERSGCMMKFDLQKGFPILTAKKVFFKTAVRELLWFLSGSTNIKPLVEQNVHIWDEWPYAKYVKSFASAGSLSTTSLMSQDEFVECIKNDDNFASTWGEVGPLYGKQWRSWDDGLGSAIDQVEEVINQLKTNPGSRRLIISGWNVADLPYMVLPPCHTMYQFMTRGKYLDLVFFCRSQDLFLGTPFNIVEAALLTHMIAQVTGFVPGELTWFGGSCHIYANHLEQVKLQLTREPKALPFLEMDSSITDIDDFRPEHFNLLGYVSDEKISAPIAV